jgi:hypothetical protein
LLVSFSICEYILFIKNNCDNTFNPSVELMIYTIYMHIYMYVTKSACLVMCLACQSVFGARKWQNSTSLWQHAVTYGPKDVVAHYNLVYIYIYLLVGPSPFKIERERTRTLAFGLGGGILSFLTSVQFYFKCLKPLLCHMYNGNMCRVVCMKERACCPRHPPYLNKQSRLTTRMEQHGIIGVCVLENLFLISFFLSLSLSINISCLPVIKLCEQYIIIFSFFFFLFFPFFSFFFLFLKGFYSREDE